MLPAAFDQFQAEQLRSAIEDIVSDVREKMSSVLATDDMLMSWVSEATPQIQEDLTRYISIDPAAHGSYELVHQACVAFRAVAAYRIARAIWQDQNLGDESARILPRYVSERAKVRSGVEIHPGASIGRRFVVDHGFNTVVGETCEIGDDVTILNNVVLGALAISHSEQKKRHPTLGHGVKVAGNVKIFGPVVIGDNVVVNAGVIVVGRNIAADTRLSLVAMIQVDRGAGPNARARRIYGVVPDSPGTFAIHGKGLSEADVSMQICRWPTGRVPRGAPADCTAVTEVASVGKDSANWHMQCEVVSDRLLRVAVSRIRQPGIHDEQQVQPPELRGDDVEPDHLEQNVRLILAFDDGQHVELESEELTTAVIESTGCAT
ncbi:serine O-acetyltransferase [Bradyrhizobium oligotrophicum]